VELLTVGVGVSHSEQTSELREDEFKQTSVYLRAMMNY
jgi:hypothetical protein